VTTFHALDLSKPMLKTLASLGYETPTPIQQQAIPHVLAGRDLVGLAQTGTGKTAAFGVPMVETLMNTRARPEPRHVRTLILAPTRELVNQIADNLKSLVKRTPLKVGLVVGGASINAQIRMLERGLDILVSTPGRLLDLVERKALSLSRVSLLVLDEADQMLDLGFIHDLRRIVKLVPQERQTLLFSATMPRQIADLAATYLNDPVRVEVSPPGKAADKVRQSVHFVADRNGKTALLGQSLADNADGFALVFARTKHGAEKLMKQLAASGFKTASIHGNKSQNQRERALRALKSGEIQVLVATDVAARGIDIPAVSHVYNFDLPEVPDAYVHRIGRTARAGREGEAIAFCAPDELRLLRDIERLMGIDITVASGQAPSHGEQQAARATRRTGRGHKNGSGERTHRHAGQGRNKANGNAHARPGQKPAAGRSVSHAAKTGSQGRRQRPSGKNAANQRRSSV